MAAFSFRNSCGAEKTKKWRGEMSISLENLLVKDMNSRLRPHEGTLVQRNNKGDEIGKDGWIGKMLALKALVLISPVLIKSQGLVVHA